MGRHFGPAGLYSWYRRDPPRRCATPRQGQLSSDSGAGGFAAAAGVFISLTEKSALDIRTACIDYFLLFCCYWPLPVWPVRRRISLEQTGKKCSFCHLDPAGGGELTEAGQAFFAQHEKSAGSARPSAASRVFHFVVGFLHLLTAIFWFGTILYVHLVLKPAYASSGLPRGEVRVGLASMAVMAVTGGILAVYRIHSLHTLLHTHFGHFIADQGRSVFGDGGLRAGCRADCRTATEARGRVGAGQWRPDFGAVGPL